jgi:hypothetical protein
MARAPDTLAHDLKKWAAEQLHVDIDASREQIRAAYLRGVKDQHGGANLAAREAMLILTGRAAAAKLTLAVEANEQKLLRDIDAFAEYFFAMPVPLRKHGWTKLSSRASGFPRAELRLHELANGLEIVPPPADADVAKARLILMVTELFVLRPPQRACRRQQWLSEIKSNSEWITFTKAAAALRDDHPIIAALEPDLIAQLAEADAAKIAKRDLSRRIQMTAKPPVVQKEPASRIPWLVVVAVVLILGRLIGGTSSNPRLPSTIPPRPVFGTKQEDPMDIFQKLIESKGKNGKNQDDNKDLFIGDEKPKKDPP